MPSVSVIIPIYGVERYIERCARSLFEQTLDDIEYIFVDDCTKDQSIDVLCRVIDDYPQRKRQSKIIRHKQNKGLPQARKTGVLVAKGNYIAHCDSDDWVDKDMYRAMYETAKINNADMVICDYDMTDGVCSTYQKSYQADEEHMIQNFILRNNKCCVWNKLIKRNIYFDSDIVYPRENMGEDLALILQLVIKCNSVSYIPKAYYHYFQNQSSISKEPSYDSTILRWNQYVHNIKLVEHIYSQKNLYEKYKEEFVSLKFHGKQMLWGIIDTKGVYLMWKKTFQDVNFIVLYNKNILLKDKITHILIYIKTYPFLNRARKMLFRK